MDSDGREWEAPWVNKLSTGHSAFALLNYPSMLGLTRIVPGQETSLGPYQPSGIMFVDSSGKGCF